MAWVCSVWVEKDLSQLLLEREVCQELYQEAGWADFHIAWLLGKVQNSIRSCHWKKFSSLHKISYLFFCGGTCFTFTCFTFFFLITQSCLTLCNSMDCSLPGSSVHGIFQARILEWVAISFSRGTSLPRDQTWVSRTIGRRFTVWATREAPWFHYMSL